MMIDQSNAMEQGISKLSSHAEPFWNRMRFSARATQCLTALYAGGAPPAEPLLRRFCNTRATSCSLTSKPAAEFWDG